MPQEGRSVDDARDGERQAMDSDVAAALSALRGDMNTADGFLDRYFALRASYDRDAWGKIITVLAQGSG